MWTKYTLLTTRPICLVKCFTTLDLFDILHNYLKGLGHDTYIVKSTTCVLHAQRMIYDEFTIDARNT